MKHSYAVILFLTCLSLFTPGTARGEESATSTFRIMGKFHDKSVSNLAAETAVLTRAADGWRIRTLHWSSHKRPRIE